MGQYKDFTDFNQALLALKSSAKMAEMQRLVNLANQFSPLCRDVPGEWARSYSGVMQQKYEQLEGGGTEITDVTPPEAISTVDTMLYSLKNQFVELNNAYEIAKSNFQSIQVTGTISTATLARAGWNFENPEKWCYLGSFGRDMCRAYFRSYQGSLHFKFTDTQTPVLADSNKPLTFSAYDYVDRHCIQGVHVDAFGGFEIYTVEFVNGGTAVDLHTGTVSNNGHYAFNTQTITNLNTEGVGYFLSGSHQAGDKQPLSISDATITSSIDDMLELPDTTAMLQAINDLIQ